MTDNKISSYVGTRYGISLLTFVTLLLVTAGCDLFFKHGADNQSVDQQLAALRHATDPFHDVEKARAAGWDVRFPPECLTHTEFGGMGVHQFNQDLVDDTVIVTEPELLVYEPQADGTLRFVAVEYIIPFSIRDSLATPPVLFGRPFMQNHTYHVWALHAWAWKDNPRGTFENFNPNVTCAYAGLVRTFPE